jgi:hypothetical protein
VITLSLDAGGMHRAFQLLVGQVDAAVQRGFEASLESIAARAKQTTKFTDRTGALRNSIQSDGVTGGNGAPLVGVVSFAAVSERSLRKKRGNSRRSMGGGFPYGLSQELGSSNGVKAKYFITDAIAAEDGALIESSLRAAFRGTGFEVT